MIQLKTKKNRLQEEITDKLVEFSEIMKQKNIPVITLSIYESEPQEFKGGWQDINASQYFPFEILEKEEQELIKNKKHYTRIDIVQGELPGIRTYKNPGIEQIQRRRVHPLLPKLIDESPLYYETDMSGVSYETMANTWANSNIKIEDIDQAFKEGMQNYRNVTERLYEQTGVYKSLNDLEEKISPIDKLKNL